MFEEEKVEEEKETKVSDEEKIFEKDQQRYGRNTVQSFQSKGCTVQKMEKVHRETKNCTKSEWNIRNVCEKRKIVSRVREMDNVRNGIERT